MPPAWSAIAVALSLVRASCRRPLRKRTPHSGAVRMRVVVATESPSLPIPSPSVPMSCVRKSENGWKLALRPLMVTVNVVLTWHPLQPSRLNSVNPRAVAVVDPPRRRRAVAHEEGEVGDVVLQVGDATRAVVVLRGRVVVDARNVVIRAAVDDGVGAGAVGAVLGGEVVDHRAAPRSWWW